MREAAIASLERFRGSGFNALSATKNIRYQVERSVVVAAVDVPLEGEHERRQDSAIPAQVLCVSPHIEYFTGDVKELGVIVQWPVGAGGLQNPIAPMQ
ncbi:hypothetical protein D3C71_1988360 [compost metagenome]